MSALCCIVIVAAGFLLNQRRIVHNVSMIVIRSYNGIHPSMLTTTPSAPIENQSNQLNRLSQKQSRLNFLIFCCRNQTSLTKNTAFQLNEFSELTPSSFPCSKCTAPARWIPGKNHTGCVSNRRSNRPRSHGGLVESPEVSLVDVSPSANIPPSELDTNDARD